MATKNDAGEPKFEEDIAILVRGYNYMSGTIDFKKFAEDLGDVPNADALRKRLRRYFQKYSINLTIYGDNVGKDAAAVAKSPRKVSDADADVDTPKTPRTPKAGGRATKRKSVQMEEDGENDADEGGQAQEEGNDVVDADTVAAAATTTTPKRAKGTPKASRSKTPKTPKAPKSPKTPKSGKGRAKALKTADGSDDDAADAKDDDTATVAVKAAELDADKDETADANDEDGMDTAEADA